ncbi:MAG: pyruvate, phosphate dikinase [Hyphomicrobiaceae bacterium]|nr:pyruvate, phosphate dikinase [Hyphomicrobiaceae bacterium]
MSLAQQMIVIAPADGPAPLSAEQRSLLTGKARWLRAVFEGGLLTVPTIAITRAAWQGLLDEKSGGEERLRTAWVTTLFRLVQKGSDPPLLAVRTAAESHSHGLMRAQLNVAPPRTEAEAVDRARPLARSITEAFASYGDEPPVWTDHASQMAWQRQIVIVQAMAEGRLIEFLSRDPQTGDLIPTAPRGGHLPEPIPEMFVAVAELLDNVAGKHMLIHVIERDAHVRFLSARGAPASAEADLNAAVDRAERGIWSTREAVNAINPTQLSQLLHPRLARDENRHPIASGLGVALGAATGRIVFSPEDAGRLRARGIHSVLVMMETGPTDVEGMHAASGIVTARGGMTSHAAVVARVIGRPCIAGIRTLSIDEAEQTCRIGDVELRAGDDITIDGTLGEIYLGRQPLSQPAVSGAISRLLDWSDGSRTIEVRTNVETVAAAENALNFGAEGIGLARSEHMFFSVERMRALRRLILSENEQDRAQALEGLVEYQTGDFADLFAVMAGRPVTVRLFDPPLHEFLPRTDEDIEETAESLGLSVRALHQRLGRLTEINPMLGHRGCRLAITYPEILDMQMRALFAGAHAAIQRMNTALPLEIMVPFVSSAHEVQWVKQQIMRIAAPELEMADGALSMTYGTMIELPRAALRAGEIAHSVDFFSFGTNDLTQTTYGISRDDSPAFLAAYQRKGLYDYDPFVTVDQRGVGELIRVAIERGRAANPDLKIGICGEHAGEPKSIEFFASLNVDYVSCSPYQVPVARLALAQAQS